MKVTQFRGRVVPLYVKTKTQLVAWALLLSKKQGKPISNGEFAFDLRVLRYGGLIHNLRQQGWKIETIRGENRGEFYFELKYVPSYKTVTSQLSTIVYKGGK